MKFVIGGKTVLIPNGRCNPKPSTPRGRRRHEARDENRKQLAAQLWKACAG